MLRKHGYNVPAPILTNYAWPGSFAPFDAQRSTCAHLTMNPRAYVLSGMGTGKTKAALWSWDYLYSNNLVGKLIIFAPLSTLHFVWAREILATIPHRRYGILHGDRRTRFDKLANADPEIYIVNHDGHKVLHEELDKHPEINCMILDELAVYRNGGSKRTKMMRIYAANMKWVWGMTGSPIPTSPTDAWAQATIITPHTVPRYFGSFRNELMIKVNNFKFVPRNDAADRAFRALQPPCGSRWTIS